MTLFFKHVKWKNPKSPLFNVEELRKFRLKLQTQLSALEKSESDRKIKVTEGMKPIEKRDPNHKDEQNGFFLSSYLYWPVKTTLETSTISDYIKSLKIEKPKELPQSKVSNNLKSFNGRSSIKIGLFAACQED